jgi:glyoxylase I family protein
VKLKSHHSSFPVRDSEVSKAFYGGVLGLKEIPRPASLTFPGAWYQAGPCEIHLLQVPDGVDVGSNAPGLTPFARHEAFEVESCDEAMAHFEAHGIEVLKIAAAGGQFWIRDPDGHVLEFIQPGRR